VINDLGKKLLDKQFLFLVYNIFPKVYIKPKKRACRLEIFVSCCNISQNKKFCG